MSHRPPDMEYGRGFDRIGDGCSVAPHCLTCPRPSCVYDEDNKGGASAEKMQAAADRAVEARRLARLGLMVAEVASAIGVSRRATYRYLGVEQ